MPLPRRLPSPFLKSGALKQTLKLPVTTFPIVADSDPKKPVNVELLQKCTDNLYKWQRENLPKDNTFVLHDGPPYANGELHMGHALNKVLKDMVNRTVMLGGRRVEYRPGWDCHGLPIELKALQEVREKQMATQEQEFIGSTVEDGSKDKTVKRKKEEGIKESTTGALEIGKKLSPGEIRRVAKELAEKTVEKQMEGFKQWAVMGDWEERYKTMDKDYEVRQLEVFLEMLKKDLIYRRFKPVYWSPSSGTALAEAELEYNESHTSTAAFIRFPIVKLGPGLHRNTILEDESPLFAAIWTTTPWTLPANKAIAVSPEMTYAILETEKYGRLLVAEGRLEHLKEVLGDPEASIEADGITGEQLTGTLYRHPLHPEKSAQSQPILTADFVTSDSGTGLVHCAPGHGFDDYQLCQFHAIQPFSPVDNSGRFTDEALPHNPGLLEGKEVLYAGNKAVLELMSAAKAILHIQNKYKHKYPYDWRTKQPVIIRATAQWFADVYSIKDAAINSLEDVIFVPESGRNRLEKTVEGRSEWCISRQRAWGVPIPALYNIETGEPLLTEESVKYIIGVFAEHGGVDAWWDKSLPEDLFVPESHKSTAQWVRGAETMDVWFDSGSSWSMLDTTGRVLEGKPLADLYLEGSDQHRGWFQSSLLTHIACSKSPVIPTPETSKPKPTAPFGMILTHGFVLDANGRKMSKSLGNVIVPEDIIRGKYPPSPPGSKKNIYGAGKDGPGMDALRLWAASCDYTKDVTVGKEVLVGVGEMLRKARVTGRFLVGNLAYWDGIEVPYDNLTKIDQYALLQIHRINSQVRDAYSSFHFNKAASLLSIYTSTSLSSFYLNIIKDRIYSDPSTSLSRRAAQTVLSHILYNYLSLLHPLVPLLTQEIYHHLPAHLKKLKSPDGLELGPGQWGWYKPDEKWNDADLKREFLVLEELMGLVNNALEMARDEGRVKVGLETRVAINTHSLPSPSTPPTYTSKILSKYRDELSQLFIVSEVEVGTIHDSASRSQDANTTSENTTEPIPLPGEWTTVLPRCKLENGDEVTIVVQKARKEKCVRCWVYQAEEEGGVCERCEKAVWELVERGEVKLGEREEVD